MAKLLSALAAGLIFGFGLGLSHMVDPAKVLKSMELFSKEVMPNLV